jgi:hypothetical protein
MKKNNFPGFVAERSLESNPKTYSAAFSISRSPQIIPQMKMECLVNALSEYSNCFSQAFVDVSACAYGFHNALFYCEYP